MPASEVTIICLPAWLQYSVSLQVRRQLLPSKHDWTKWATAPGPTICCSLAAGCEREWKNGVQLNVAWATSSGLIWCMLVHLCQQTSMWCSQTWFRSKCIWKTGTYVQGSKDGKKKKMRRKGFTGFGCLNSAIWNSLALFSVITFYKYRMSFPKLSWEPNHLKVSSTASAKLWTSARRNCF